MTLQEEQKALEDIRTEYVSIDKMIIERVQILKDKEEAFVMKEQESNDRITKAMKDIANTQKNIQKQRKEIELLFAVGTKTRKENSAESKSLEAKEKSLLALDENSKARLVDVVKMKEVVNEHRNELSKDLFLYHEEKKAFETAQSLLDDRQAEVDSSESDIRKETEKILIREMKVQEKEIEIVSASVTVNSQKAFVIQGKKELEKDTKAFQVLDNALREDYKLLKKDKEGLKIIQKEQESEKKRLETREANLDGKELLLKEMRWKMVQKYKNKALKDKDII